jgi:hypothetical protein
MCPAASRPEMITAPPVAVGDEAPSVSRSGTKRFSVRAGIADPIRGVGCLQDLSANSSSRTARLKIVVSPVRVRVSPSQTPKFRMSTECSTAGGMATGLMARVHEMVVVSSVRVRVRRRLQNACKSHGCRRQPSRGCIDSKRPVGLFRPLRHAPTSDRPETLVDPRVKSGVAATEPPDRHACVRCGTANGWTHDARIHRAGGVDCGLDGLQSSPRAWCRSAALGPSVRGLRAQAARSCATSSLISGISLAAREPSSPPSAWASLPRRGDRRRWHLPRVCRRAVRLGRRRTPRVPLRTGLGRHPSDASLLPSVR